MMMAPCTDENGSQRGRSKTVSVIVVHLSLINTCQPAYEYNSQGMPRGVLVCASTRFHFGLCTIVCMAVYRVTRNLQQAVQLSTNEVYISALNLTSRTCIQLFGVGLERSLFCSGIVSPYCVRRMISTRTLYVFCSQVSSLP